MCARRFSIKQKAVGRRQKAVSVWQRDSRIFNRRRSQRLPTAYCFLPSFLPQPLSTSTVTRRRPVSSPSGSAPGAVAGGRGAAAPAGLVAERLGSGGDGGPRARRRQADGLGVLQVGVNRGDDDARLDRDQVNADERDANPRVNDDAFVQHAVEHVYQTGSAGRSLNSHVVSSLPKMSRNFSADEEVKR